MSTDLRTQLAGYFDHVEEQQGAVDALELAHRDRVTELPRPERLRATPVRRGVLIAVATAVIVLLLAIPFILTIGEQDDDVPPATTPSTITTSVAPTTAASLETPTPTTGTVGAGRLSTAELPTAASAGWTWIETGLPAPQGTMDTDGFSIGRFPDGTYFAWNPGWLVGGVYDGSAGDDPKETLLLSTDGVEWTQTDLAFLEGRIAYSDLNSPYTHPVLWTVPSDFTGQLSMEAFRFWTSDDGVEWFEVDAVARAMWHRIGDTVVFDGGSEGLAVSDDGGRTLEVIEGDQFAGRSVAFAHGEGFSVLEYRSASLSATPTLWTSSDGHTWIEEGPVTDLVDYAPIGWGNVAVLEDGRILAVSTPEDVRWSSYLVSGDGGRTWTELDTTPTRPYATNDHAPLTYSLHDIGPWVVAVTEQSDRVGHVLVTQDGRNWMRLDPPINGVTPIGAAHDVVVAHVRDDAGEVRLWIAIPPSQ